VIDSALCAPLSRDFPQAGRWVVALSGGLDSCVLLHLCARYRRQHGDSPALLALHVNHGVHPDADDWVAHCARICRDLDIAFESQRASGLPGAGVSVSENALRVARYRVYEQFCQRGDLLLLAHHRRDQVETVLLRLLRGAGVAGLAGMPFTRRCGEADLVRPLLDVAPQELQAYAREHGLSWVEDPSNAATTADRNFLRLEVLPLMEQRWPGAQSSIARAARNLGEAGEICAQRATEDIAACTLSDRFMRNSLDLQAWRSLEHARRVNALRVWLSDRGVGNIDAQRLRVMEHELIRARNDAQPGMRFGPVQIRRYRDRLCALSSQSRELPSGIELPAQGELHIAGVGRLWLRQVAAGGVRAGGVYRIGFPRPGVRIQSPGRPGKTLKQLAQEHAIPPWWRHRIPLLFVDGELAAVADICVDQGALAAEPAPGVLLGWEPADS
jgi:tRNA(Ile)-lysidine synthase